MIRVMKSTVSQGSVNQTNLSVRMAGVYQKLGKLHRLLKIII